MKKKVISIIFAAMLLTGCNKQIIDLDYNYKYAEIDGIGRIELKSWNDYENSDMIQVTGKDGTVYLTHSSKVVLISK